MWRQNFFYSKILYHIVILKMKLYQTNAKAGGNWLSQGAHARLRIHLRIGQNQLKRTILKLDWRCQLLELHASLLNLNLYWIKIAWLQFLSSLLWLANSSLVYVILALALWWNIFSCARFKQAYLKWQAQKIAVRGYSLQNYSL